MSDSSSCIIAKGSGGIPLGLPHLKIYTSLSFLGGDGNLVWGGGDISGLPPPSKWNTEDSAESYCVVSDDSDPSYR